MSKPTLFLSHSSVDKDYLNVLKDLLITKTSNTIDVFLSSDGQSIPFGRNWVHKVEKALDDASVMFVALSPQSVNSAWIYFESGYAYSRGIRVIPIGIMGLDIGQLPPPLSLLQGFNITSQEGLNNIIDTINNEYKFNFSEDYQEEDFQKLLMIVSDSYREALRLSELIDFIESRLPESINIGESVVEMPSDKKTPIYNKLKQLGADYFPLGDNKVMLNGMRIDLQKNVIRGRKSDDVLITVDPLRSNQSLSIIGELWKELYMSNAQVFYFNVFFPESFEIITDDYKISSRVLDIGMEIVPEYGRAFKFRNISFTITGQDGGDLYHRPQLMVRANIDSEEEIPLYDLLSCLIDTGVIKPK